MTSLADRVLENVSSECITDLCDRDGCSIDLTDSPKPYTLVDLDHPKGPANQSQSRCDYIFVGGDDWVAPIELTSGRADASKFQRQLQAGADIAEKIVPHGQNFSFRPIAVYGRESHPAEINQLRGTIRITFRCQQERIRLVNCESRLPDALNSAT